MKKSSLLLLIICTGVLAQDTTQLIINVREFKPMVMRENGKLTGFDIDFFNEIARRMGKTVFFNELGTNDNLIDPLKDGKSHGSIAGITITKEREFLVDFSHTYFRSGLMILIRENGLGMLDTIKMYLSIFTSKLPLFLGYLAYTLLAAYLIFLYEKGNTQFHDTNIYEGMFDGWYWVNVVITSTGFGDKVPLSKRGKILAILLMWTGIYFMAPMITASMASDFTIAKQKNYIQSKEELKGRTVAVKINTTGARYVEGLGAHTVLVKNVAEGVELLKNKKVDAVVHDAPAILYAQHKNMGVTTVGRVFDRQDYGIALPTGSPYAEQINRLIPELRSDGTYDQIYNHYFGRFDL